MALRALLRRIPCAALRSTSDPRMGTLKAASPAGAVRFMGSVSQDEQPATMTIAEAEEEMSKIFESIEVGREDFKNEMKKLHEDWIIIHKERRQAAADFSRSFDNLRKLEDLAFAAVIVVPWFF